MYISAHNQSALSMHPFSACYILRWDLAPRVSPAACVPEALPVRRWLYSPSPAFDKAMCRIE